MGYLSVGDLGVGSQFGGLMGECWLVNEWVCG